MKKYFISVLLLLSIFALTDISFARELTERERNIYNDYVEVLFSENLSDEELDLELNKILEKYNTTDGEVIEIYYYETEGLIRLTSVEQKIYDEYHEKVSLIKDKYIPVYDEIDRSVLDDHDITSGELNNLSADYYYSKLYLIPTFGKLTLEQQEKYDAAKGIIEDYNARRDPIDAQQENEIEALRGDLEIKHNISADNMDNILYRGMLGLTYKE